MSDLIRREDAIEILSERAESLRGMQGDLGGACRGAMRIIEALPSAEPERKWIPFDVALPNDRQKVLCINKHDEMMVGGYLTDYGMTFPCYFEKPIALMPLPEPWRGE